MVFHSNETQKSKGLSVFPISSFFSSHSGTLFYVLKMWSSKYEKRNWIKKWVLPCYKCQNHNFSGYWLQFKSPGSTIFGFTHNLANNLDIGSVQIWFSQRLTCKTHLFISDIKFWSMWCHHDTVCKIRLLMKLKDQQKIGTLDNKRW